MFLEYIYIYNYLEKGKLSFLKVSRNIYNFLRILWFELLKHM